MSDRIDWLLKTAASERFAATPAQKVEAITELITSSKPRSLTNPANRAKWMEYSELSQDPTNGFPNHWDECIKDELMPAPFPG